MIPLQLQKNNIFNFLFFVMKKYTLIILFLFLTTAAFSQHKPYQFGFKVSGNIGWFNSYNDNFNSSGVKPGFTWGFVSDIFLMENYSVTTGFEMLFLNGNLDYPYQTISNTDTTIGIISSTFKTKYLQLPVVFTMKTNDIKGIRYFGQIGGSIGIKLNAREEGTLNGATIKNNDSDMFTLFRGAFILGAGIEYPINGSTYLRLGIQYNNNFNSVLKGYNSAYPDTKNEARSNYLELNANIIF